MIGSKVKRLMSDRKGPCLSNITGRVKPPSYWRSQVCTVSLKKSPLLSDWTSQDFIWLKGPSLHYRIIWVTFVIKLDESYLLSLIGWAKPLLSNSNSRLLSDKEVKSTLSSRITCLFVWLDESRIPYLIERASLGFLIGRVAFAVKQKKSSLYCPIGGVWMLHYLVTTGKILLLD